MSADSGRHGKINVVLPFPGFGGGECLLSQICRSLRQDGHRVELRIDTLGDSHLKNRTAVKVLSGFFGWLLLWKFRMPSLITIFRDIPGPRSGNAQRHDLLDILTIALVDPVCGAEGCVYFFEFAVDREVLLKEFLSLENGLPSHDTFSRVFQRPLNGLYKPR